MCVRWKYINRNSIAMRRQTKVSANEQRILACGSSDRAEEAEKFQKFINNHGAGSSTFTQAHTHTKLSLFLSGHGIGRGWSFYLCRCGVFVDFICFSQFVCADKWNGRASPADETRERPLPFSMAPTAKPSRTERVRKDSRSNLLNYRNPSEKAKNEREANSRETSFKLTHAHAARQG